MSAMIVSRDKKFGIVGAYVPPKDYTTLLHIMEALGRFPWQRNVILVGNLNLDLDSVEPERDSEIAQLLAASRLHNMHHHFTSHQKFKR